MYHHIWILFKISHTVHYLGHSGFSIEHLMHSIMQQRVIMTMWLQTVKHTGYGLCNDFTRTVSLWEVHSGWSRKKQAFFTHETSIFFFMNMKLMFMDIVQEESVTPPWTSITRLSLFSGHIGPAWRSLVIEWLNGWLAVGSCWTAALSVAPWLW